MIIYLAQKWGWSMAFHLTAVPGIILAWLIYRYVNGKKDPAFSAAPAAGKAANKAAYGELFKIKNVALCILISCVFVTWFMIIITFTPTFGDRPRLRRRHDGRHHERHRRRLGALGCGGAGDFRSPRPQADADLLSLLAVCCPLFLSYVDNPWLLGVLVFLSYTGLGCFTLFMATIPSETVSPARIATALGLVMGIGEVIGGCLAPFIAGLIADRYGLVSVMWLAAAGAVCAGVLSCFLDETAPRW